MFIRCTNCDKRTTCEVVTYGCEDHSGYRSKSKAKWIHCKECSIRKDCEQSTTDGGCWDQDKVNPDYHRLNPEKIQVEKMVEQEQVYDGEVSDGSTASYYELPSYSAELQDLISYKDMNAQMGEIFRAVYRYGQVSHSGRLRDAKKIKFYIEAEIERLERLDRGEI